MAKWERTCRITKVMQEDRNGCGVACLAMVAGISYADARLTFLSYGFGSEHRRNGKQPFLSNFTELMLVSAEHGIDSKMKRWRGWDQFEGLGIIKVGGAPGGRKNQWHWVVAEKHEQFDVVIHDPDFHLPSFRRNPPQDVVSQPFESYEPHGCWISLK